MNKKIRVVFLVSFILAGAYPGNIFAQIDSEAVVILDSMSNVVTDLGSCSFTLKTEFDVYNEDLGNVKLSDVSKIYMRAPDKLLVNKKGDNGQKNFYYNGKTFTYYSVDHNQYADVPAPPTIMETIDSLSSKLGVEFPAADIFYDDLVDSVLANSNILSYLGLTDVEDKECFHVAGATDSITYQLWISADGSYLPAKMVINYITRTGNPQYEALFLDWKLNPVLNDSMFDFVEPEGARKIKFIKKK